MGEFPSPGDVFRQIFDEAPAPLWVGDLSGVRKFIDRLRSSGVDDPGAYVESHQEAISACVKKINVIRVNKAALNLYQANNNQQFLEGINKTFTQEPGRVFRENLVALAEGGSSSASEAVAKTLTGEVIHVLIRISVVSGYENTWSRLLVSMDDISERKQAEDALESSEARFLALTEASAAAIFVFRDRILYANPAFEELWGYASDELRHLEISDLVAPESIAEVQQHWQEHKQGKTTPSYYEIKLKRKDGETRWGCLSSGLTKYDGRNAAIGIIIDITERKRMEQKLELFRDLMDESNDGVFVIEPDTGRFLDVNKAACVRLGYSLGELLTMGVQDIETTLPDAQAWKAHVRGMKGPGLLTFEGEHQRKNGSVLPVEISSKYVRQEDGEFIVTTVRDITARKRHERLLARRERQLAVLAEAGRSINETLDERQVARTLVDLARRLVNCEAGGVGLYRGGKMCFREYAYKDEYRPIELDFTSGYGVPGHVLATRECYVSNDAMHDVHTIPEIRQSLDFFKLADTPILDGEGNILGCFEMHDRLDGEDFDDQDMEMLKSLAGIVAAALQNMRLLDERTRAKEQLRRTNRTLRMLSDCNQALIRASDEQRLLEEICSLVVGEGEYRMAWVGEVVYDHERHIVPLAKAGFEDGYLESTRISWADDQFGRGPAGRAIREGHPVVCQDILHDPVFSPWREQAAGRGYASSMTFPLTVNGEVAGLLNIYASEPNAFHAGEIDLLGELAGDLAFGIEVLRNRQAREMLEEQFVQAQKMEAVGALAGGLAHDFNNMLAGMLGTVYLVRNTLTDHPEAREKLKLVETTGFRAAGMLAQLLTFARKGATNMQPMSLPSFLKEAFKLAHGGVPENISFTLVVPEGECVVLGDATLLQQVLLNLVTNARHAVTGRVHPVIHVSLKVSEANEALWKRHPDIPRKRYVRLTVEDNGRGVPEACRGKLFEPFFTTKSAGEGTGLGLSMVYGAVQSHHGVIEVESEEGTGSAFHVFLPLLEQADIAPSSEEEEVRVEGHGETILLADDEELVCEVSRELLESMGYRVLIAANGEEAVRLFGEHRDEIRLAILDVVMPQLSGVDAALRMRVASPGLPILFQTGYGERQVRREMEGLKGCRIVSKPTSVPELSRIFRELLDGGS